MSTTITSHAKHDSPQTGSEANVQTVDPAAPIRLTVFAADVTNEIKLACLGKASELIFDELPDDVLAQKLKDYLVSVDGGKWNCVVGEDFGTWLTPKRYCFLNFVIGSRAILCFVAHQ